MGAVGESQRGHTAQVTPSPADQVGIWAQLDVPLDSAPGDSMVRSAVSVVPRTSLLQAADKNFPQEDLS